LRARDNHSTRQAVGQTFIGQDFGNETRPADQSGDGRRRPAPGVHRNDVQHRRLRFRDADTAVALFRTLHSYSVVSDGGHGSRRFHFRNIQK
jgi:hypothetical protein